MEFYNKQVNEITMCNFDALILFSKVGLQEVNDPQLPGVRPDPGILSGILKMWGRQTGVKEGLPGSIHDDYSWMVISRGKKQMLINTPSNDPSPKPVRLVKNIH